MTSPEPQYSHISPDQVASRIVIGDAPRLVDVREPWEYARYRISSAVLMPMSEFAERAARELVPEEEIVLICEHGVRSEAAARYLAAQGYRHVATMVGGMASYRGTVERGN